MYNSKMLHLVAPKKTTTDRLFQFAENFSYCWIIFSSDSEVVLLC